MAKWLRRAGHVVAALVAIIGLAGVPGDVRAWGSFFSSLDSNLARWLLVLAGLTLLGAIQFLPRGRGAGERQPDEQAGGSTATAVVPGYAHQLSAEQQAALNRQVVESQERLNHERAGQRSRLDDSIEAGDALLATLERGDRPPAGGFEGEVSAWASEARSVVSGGASPASGVVVDSVTGAASDCLRRFDSPPVAYNPHDETGPLKSEMRARLRTLRELRAELDQS